MTARRLSLHQALALQRVSDGKQRYARLGRSWRILTDEGSVRTKGDTRAETLHRLKELRLLTDEGRISEEGRAALIAHGAPMPEGP